MLLFAAMAGAILLIGWRMRAPVQARTTLIGLLYVVFLAAKLVLPETHPLSVAIGATVQEWALVGVVIVLVIAYRAVLARVRSHAEVAQAERAAARPAAADAGPFGADEVTRYARHITLREIGGPGQQALKKARVLVIGAGGLGSPALLYLAAGGVGTLGVIDADEVALSNLQRQVIHTDARTGMPKVFSAEATIAALNPFVTVRPYHRALSADIAEELFGDYDLILDGTDSYAARAVANAAAVATGRPLIAGAISAWEGQVTLYDPAGGAPCLACVFPKAPAAGLSATCAESGVIGPLPGVIGTLMAAEAIKEITGAGDGLRGRMLIWDGLGAEMRTVRIARRADCPVCGGM